MFKRITDMVLLLLLSTGHFAFADAPVGYPFVSFDQAMQEARETDRPVFVYFGRYGCGYCEKTNKEAFSMPEVKEVFTSHYVLAYVDAESGSRLRLPGGERITERELGTRYNVFVTPVFSFLTGEGELISQIIGVQSKQSLLAVDKKVQKVLSDARL